MPQPDLVREKLNYTAIALSALRRLPPTLCRFLRDREAWVDVVAWAMVGAVEGYVNHWDFRDTYNAAQRYIYRALKAEGFRRQSREKNGSAMQYQRHELRYSQINDDLLTEALVEILEERR